MSVIRTAVRLCFQKASAAPLNMEELGLAVKLYSFALSESERMNKKSIIKMKLRVRILLVPLIKNHLSSFKLGFLNIFSSQNVLRSLSLVLFLLQRYKYGAKKCPKNQVRFDI